MASTSNCRCDALIVGAGPAGAYLGYLLARQGVDVVIIDKQQFPRDKVCGGGVSRKAIDLLDFDFGAVVQGSIRGAVLTYRNRMATVKDIEPSAGCTVLRSEFDQLLLDKACAEGARFLPATAFVDATDAADSVNVSTDRGEFRCRRLFAADGAGSVVRDRVFGKHLVRYVPSLEALVYLDEEALARFEQRAVFDFGCMPSGYGWIFPKRDHANVGVYSPFAGRALRSHLEAFIGRYDALRNSVRVDYRGSIILLRNLRDEYQRGRVSLLGDAAGFAEAVFGEGIYFALKSATLAARAVAERGLDGDAIRRTGATRFAARASRCRTHGVADVPLSGFRLSAPGAQRAHQRRLRRSHQRRGRLPALPGQDNARLSALDAAQPAGAVAGGLIETSRGRLDWAVRSLFPGRDK